MFVCIVCVYIYTRIHACVSFYTCVICTYGNARVYIYMCVYLCMRIRCAYGSVCLHNVGVSIYAPYVRCVYVRCAYGGCRRGMAPWRWLTGFSPGRTERRGEVEVEVGCVEGGGGGGD